jgi:hypothetical protein
MELTMGNVTFYVRSHGKTPEVAFENAVKKAKSLHKHAGYTGTINEDYHFVLHDQNKHSPEEAQSLSEKLLLTTSFPQGKIGCLLLDTKPLIQNEYLFFGRAV